MKDISLASVLKQIDIKKCQEIIKDEVYYIKKNVTQKYYSEEKIKRIKNLDEFIVITNNGKIVGGIYIMRKYDLHWYIFKKYRKNHYLSNVLRKKVLDKICPDTKEITCCDKDVERCKHLAKIAGLKIIKRCY